jgi:hypothetical protein
MNAGIELEQRRDRKRGRSTVLRSSRQRRLPTKPHRAAVPGARASREIPPDAPSRIHPPAAVAKYVIARKTVPLAKKLRDLALAATARCCGSGFSLLRRRGAARRIGPRWSRTGPSCAVCGRRSPRPPRKARSRRGKPIAGAPRQYRDQYDVRTCRRRARMLWQPLLHANKPGRNVCDPVPARSFGYYRR